MFEEIELVAKNQSEHGIDWSLVYRRTRDALQAGALSLSFRTSPEPDWASRSREDAGTARRSF